MYHDHFGMFWGMWPPNHNDFICGTPRCHPRGGPNGQAWFFNMDSLSRSLLLWLCCSLSLLFLLLLLLLFSLLLLLFLFVLESLLLWVVLFFWLWLLLTCTGSDILFFIHFFAIQSPNNYLCCSTFDAPTKKTRLEYRCLMLCMAQLCCRIRRPLYLQWLWSGFDKSSTKTIDIYTGLGTWQPLVFRHLIWKTLYFATFLSPHRRISGPPRWPKSNISAKTTRRKSIEVIAHKKDAQT